MKAIWFKDCEKNSKEYEKRLRDLEAARPILERLATILEKNIEASYKDEKENYYMPGWPYYQARKKGLQSAYKQIRDLVKLED